MKGKVLIRQCVLTYSFEKRNPQRARIVDQFAHLFAGDIKFAHVSTCKPLVNQTLKSRNGLEKDSSVWKHPNMLASMKIILEIKHYIYSLLLGWGTSDWLVLTELCKEIKSEMQKIAKLYTKDVKFLM